jgi:hypothetical protein
MADDEENPFQLALDFIMGYEAESADKVDAVSPETHS